MREIPYGAIEFRHDIKRDSIPIVKAGDAIEGQLERFLGNVRRIATEANGCLKIEYFNPGVNKKLIENRRTLPNSGHSHEEMPFAYITLSQPRFIHPSYGQVDTIGVYIFADDQEVKESISKIIFDELFGKSQQA